MFKCAVVTGVGVVSPIGIGKSEFWKGLMLGRSGVGPLSNSSIPGFEGITAGEIKEFNAGSYIGDRGLKYYSKCTKFAAVASKLALEDANLSAGSYSGAEIGIVIGSTFGSLESVKSFYTDALLNGFRYVNPMLFPNTMTIAPSSQVAINHGIKGINRTLSTGSTSGMDAVCYAVDLIRSGNMKVVVAGGVEELCSFLYVKSDTGKGYKDRSCIYGEGCGILILEEMEYAMNRGADIFALVMGCGQSFSSDGDMQASVMKSIERAICESKISCHHIDGIYSGGNTGEKNTLHRLFGMNPGIHTNCIKTATGECFAALSAWQVCAAALSIKNNTMPPVNRTENESGLDYKMNLEGKHISNVLCSSYSDNGSCAALILSAYGQKSV